MNSVSNFLQKFLKLEKDNSARVSLILEIIKKETGLELPKEALETKGDSLKIKSSPIIRNEIFMHKEKIEDSLKSQKIFLKLV